MHTASATEAQPLVSTEAAPEDNLAHAGVLLAAVLGAVRHVAAAVERGLPTAADMQALAAKDAAKALAVGEKAGQAREAIAALLGDEDAAAQPKTLVQAGTVLEMARRVWSEPGDGCFCLDHDGSVVEFKRPDMAARLSARFGRNLGGRDSLAGVLLADRARAGMVALTDAVASLKIDMPDPEKALAAVLSDWVLDTRQASAAPSEIEDMFAEGVAAGFPLPRRLRIVRPFRGFPDLGVDVLTAEMALTEFFIGPDPEHPRVPGSLDLIDAMAAARFAPDRREAFVWLHMPPGSGKGLLIGALAALNWTCEISQSEAEKAMSGEPSGLTVERLRGKGVLVFNEFHGLKREIKEFESAISFAPKGKARVDMPVYMKLFLSAEDNLALTGAGGVESQFADRFSYLANPAACRAEELPLFQMLGPGAFRDALATGIANRLTAHFERYRAMGREGASCVAAAELHAFHAKHTIRRIYADLADTLDETAAEFAAWVWKAWRSGDHRDGVEIVSAARADGVPTFLLKRPAAAWELFLSRPGNTPSYKATFGRKRTAIFERIHPEGSQGQVKSQGAKLKGLILPPDPASGAALPEAVRLIVDNTVGAPQ